MIDPLKKLIEALRDELKNYGEMLVLLERQQEHLLTRASHEAVHCIGLVQAQGSILQEVRLRREECRRAVAQAAAQDAEACFTDLLPLVPTDYQPLLKALVEENNELLSRVRRRAGQNHLMLKRSVDLMQKVLNALHPPGVAPECASEGKSRLRSRSRRRLPPQGRLSHRNHG